MAAARDVGQGAEATLRAALALARQRGGAVYVARGPARLLVLTAAVGGERGDRAQACRPDDALALPGALPLRHAGDLMGALVLDEGVLPDADAVLLTVLADHAAAGVWRLAAEPPAAAGTTPGRSPMAQLAHDLRGPLTGIQGLSEVLADEEVSTEEVHLFARRINAEAKRLGRIISEALDPDPG
jgi:signal transduction histidine kinase